jgi:AcrR family transcriptional regulator
MSTIAKADDGTGELTGGKNVRERSNNRGQPLLDNAARLFADRGYMDTTIREVASACDMLPGSVYYHHSSKQNLLLAVYETGVTQIKDRIQAAAAKHAKNDNPWDLLEAVVVAHLETILDQSDYARVIVGISPSQVPEIYDELRALRDEYENAFAAILDTLDLPADVDPKMLRLMLLGALNGTQTWYRPGRKTPAEIGSAFVAYLRNTLDSRQRK